MRERPKIIKIRPFNMANFSGSYSYIFLFVILGVMVIVPAVTAIALGLMFNWLVIIRPAKLDDNILNYDILRERLNRILLPICSVLYLILIIPIALLLPQISPADSWDLERYANLTNQAPAILLGAAILPLGVYAALTFSAFLLRKRGNIPTSTWLLRSSALMVVLTVTGIVSALALSSAGVYIGMFLDFMSFR